MIISPYPDATSHLLDHLDRLALRFEGRHDELAEAEARIAARVRASDLRLPLRDLAQAAPLDELAVAVLVTVAGPAFDGGFGAALRQRLRGAEPSIEELLSILAGSRPEEAALLATLAPAAPLVARELVAVVGPETSPLQRVVRVDERVQRFLRGDRALDAPLRAVAQVWTSAPPHTSDLPLLRAALDTPGPIVVEGPAGVGKTCAAAAAVVARGGAALVIDLAALADHPSAAALIPRLRREALLLGARLVVRGADWSDAWPAALRREALGLVEDGAIATVRDAAVLCRALRGPRRIAIPMPTTDEQHRIWCAVLGAGVATRELCERYPLPPRDIVLAAEAARAAGALERRPVVSGDVRRAARARLQHRLGDVAELVATTLGWHDLVVPDDVAARVREIIDAVRCREHVMERWGFAAKLPYGRSISALLAGPPGTGKTMIATLIAKELGLEVFRIDLSKVVSKYIGETERQLDAVFTEAARCRAILLFDEADALFARRTAVKTSNDRYANLETNFLLQRLEAHDGIVLLTTNAATSLDPAFARRLRYHLELPEPDAEDRARLWRAMIPATTPLAGDVDLGDLARRFRMTGGHIKNAAVRAAYVAAAAGAAAIDHATLVGAAMCEWTALGHLSPAAAPSGAPPPPPSPPPAAHAVPPAVERRMREILTAPLGAGETIEAGHRRKEHELGAVLSTLGVAPSRALHRRLSSPAHAGDELAQQFGRLSVERRRRLLAFVADVRRRLAKLIPTQPEAV